MNIQRLNRETKIELNSDMELVVQSADGTFTLSKPESDEYYKITIDDHWVLNRMKRLMGLIQHEVETNASK